MRIFEWFGGLMMIVALMEFIPNPKKALQNIPEVLATNAKMVNGHLVISRDGPRSKSDAPKSKRH